MQGIKLIPKRKLNQEESESVLLARALEYLNSIIQSQISTLSEIDLGGHLSSTSAHAATVQTLTNKTLTSPSISSGTTITGLGTGANGFVLKNLKNSVASALSGTQKDIAIDIGGSPYYFTCFPSKA